MIVGTRGKRAAIVATIVLTLIVVLSLAAQQNEPDECFGGALSADPLHCEVIAWAHNEGVIEVDAVYRAGTALYIYLVQSDLLYGDDDALQKMLTKAQEVARDTGEYDCVLNPRLCDSGVLGIGSSDYFLPVTSAYQTIRFLTGGAEARRSITGWRAFEQLWPEHDEDAGGAAGTSGDFDISGVDRTNFPTLSGNCVGLTRNSDINNVCWAWDLRPGVGIANYTDYTSDGKLYASVKVAPGEDEAAKITEAKKALIAAQPDYVTEKNLVVVPVPHDFEELWRWSLILERFANSSGNTLGIYKVELGFNWLGGLGQDRKHVFPLQDAPNLDDHWRETGFTDGSRTRVIIQVGTYEFDKTVAGLPRLLKQLEIPENAVGLIYQVKDHIYQRPVALTDQQSVVDADSPVSGTQAGFTLRQAQG